MTLAIGDRLGPYEVVSSLGAGGMGEVYRARDTRLQRDVAIKVLAGHVADRPALQERFEREARTIAGLNHPHICVLYDIGHQDSPAGSGPAIDYLVMEYLEGETLAERLKRGPLPLAEVIRYGVEIGDALDKAHRSGVTHRDLKPGNIMLTKAGAGSAGSPQAKLLDFGLAKLRAPVMDPSEQPTREAPITAQGTILGTLHYMAPEQLEGKDADARSDIFAFGAVLYEMATGKRAFDGQSQASLIAAIMGSEPAAMSALQPMTPPALDLLVRKCLRKEPDARWQSAHDITDVLRWIPDSTLSSSASHPAVSLPAAPAPPKSRLRYAWAGAAIALTAVALIGAARFLNGPAPTAGAAPVRFTVAPPENGFFPTPETNPEFLSVSPDGSRLAFVVNSVSGTRQLYIRALDSTAATPLAGSDGANSPFWSPDGRFVAFTAEGSLKKLAVSGGPVQTVVPDRVASAGAWSPAGVIVFSRGFGPLYRVSDSGGTTAPVTELDTPAGEVAHSFPHFLPDGEHFLFLARSTNPEQTAVYVGSLSSKERRRVLAEASGAIYVEPGYVLFHRNGTLMAQRFDARSLVASGEAVPVAETVQYIATTRAASFAASQSGTLAYRTASGAGPRTLVWVSRNGTEQSLPTPPRGFQQPRLSPDGRQIAVQIEERDSQIWIYDIGRETLTRLTFQGSSAATRRSSCRRRSRITTSHPTASAS